MQDALDHRLAQMREPGKFAQLGAPLARDLGGCHTEIATQVRMLPILENIASELAENRRTMAAELLGNHTDTDTSRSPSSDLAAFIHVDVGVGAFHVSFLASDKPLLSIASRTSSLNPPGYT